MLAQIITALLFVAVKGQAEQECVNASTCVTTTIKSVCLVPVCVMPTQAQARRADVHANL